MNTLTLPPSWSAADSAELDVLLHEIVTRFDEHRRTCPHHQPCEILAAYRRHKETCLCCQGDYPLTHGWQCSARDAFIEHGAGCAACNVCPHIKLAIAAVMDWREGRILRSKAEELRVLERLLAEEGA